MTVTIEVPLVTPSLTNQREHWRARHARAKVHRNAVWGCWMAVSSVARTQLRQHLVAGGHLQVTMIRRSPAAIDDDNIRGALKSVRDQLAEGLGVDDRSPLVLWSYAQERATIPVVVIRIETLSYSEEA